MDTVPYTIDAMNHNYIGSGNSIGIGNSGMNHIYEPVYIYYGLELEAYWINLIAKCCLLCGGFAMNGPKTLLGMSIRAATPSVISGTIGGLLGLIGQGGSYIGSRGLSALISRDEPFTLISMFTLLPVASNPLSNPNPVIPVIPGIPVVIILPIQSLITLLHIPITGWELFPILYSICTILTVLLLIYPAYRENERIHRQQQEIQFTKQKNI